MCKKSVDEIDFVLPWVDSNDDEWRQQRSYYAQKLNISIDESRFRCWDILQYWFRGVERFAPWVRKIHFITCGHYPIWLNKKHPKLNLVKHSDYINKDFLPTFNSHVIENNIHNIDGLAEKFVLFNDDVFILNRVNSTYFFKNDFPCDNLILDILTPSIGLSDYIYNNIRIINKYFDKKEFSKQHLFKLLNISYGRNIFKNLLLLNQRKYSRFLNFHVHQSYHRSIFVEVWQKEKNALLNTSAHKFRQPDDVNHYLFRAWQLASNRFEVVRSSSKHYSIDKRSLDKIVTTIKKQKRKIICINDTEDTHQFDLYRQNISMSFNVILGKKSSFEI